jgi:hypothetical protein
MNASRSIAGAVQAAESHAGVGLAIAGCHAFLGAGGRVIGCEARARRVLGDHLLDVRRVDVAHERLVVDVGRDRQLREFGVETRDRIRIQRAVAVVAVGGDFEDIELNGIVARPSGPPNGLGLRRERLWPLGPKAPGISAVRRAATASAV